MYRIMIQYYNVKLTAKTNKHLRFAYFQIVQLHVRE